MQRFKSFVGLDVGGTQIKAMAFNADGALRLEESAPTSDDGTKQWLNHPRGVLQRVFDRCDHPAAVGVAAPGLASADRRCIAFMPGRLAGIEGLDWQAWLNLDFPTPVFNDAQ